jgi:hypothetical protein
MDQICGDQALHEDLVREEVDESITNSQPALKVKRGKFRARANCQLCQEIDSPSI